MDGVLAALRNQVDRGIGGAAAKVVLAIRADAEVRGVAIKADLSAGFERVAGGGEGNILPPLKQVAIDADDRARRRVERLIRTVIELDAWVGLVCRGKGWGGARHADG